jgi:hypothetical protein
MYKLFLIIATMCCVLLGSHANAMTIMDYAKEIIRWNIEKDEREIDQRKAEIFGCSLANSGGESHTKIIQYRWGGDGNYPEPVFHVAYYADGFVITRIGGQQSGNQVIVLNNRVMDVSYSCEMKHDDEQLRVITNQYSWGSVHTRMNSQEVIGLNTLKK